MPTFRVVDGTQLTPARVTPIGQAPSAAHVSCQGCGAVVTIGVRHSCVDYTPSLEMAPLRGGLGSRDDIQLELDAIAASIRGFYLKQPDMVMRECSAYTARLTEMCVQLARFEATDRQYLRLRTQQVERWIVEIDRQWRTASRLIEVMRMDLSLIGGQS